MSKSATEAPRVEVADRAELRAWLARHHAQAGSIWLVTGKKGAPGYVSYQAIVEEALCFGWIDSLPRALDETRTMHLLSPRKPGSAWSKVNKAKADMLIAAGRMAAPGLAAIERAKSDGTWSKLDAVETLVVPDDLARALAAHPPAADRFDAFPRSSRRLILEWIAQARTPATRERRIEETARLAAENIRANHYRQPKRADARIVFKD